MKAAVYIKSRGIVVEGIPIPRLKKDDVLVKVRYCGICGTDLQIMRLESQFLVLF